MTNEDLNVANGFVAQKDPKNELGIKSSFIITRNNDFDDLDQWFSTQNAPRPVFYVVLLRDPQLVNL